MSDENTPGANGDAENVVDLKPGAAELADSKDRLLRTLAEAENIRKRSAKEVMEARVFAVEKFAGDLLSVSDNMSRALEALPEDERASLSERGKNLLGGIEMTQKELHAVFARHNVRLLNATSQVGKSVTAFCVQQWLR